MLISGFVLPYSLVVIRTHIPQYSGTRIYILTLGDVCGGALFSFVLIYFFATRFRRWPPIPAAGGGPLLPVQNRLPGHGLACSRCRDTCGAHDACRGNDT
ncbi:MAG: hypothetical protein R2860_15265 [Desulfobacterales bacterium]